MDGHSHSIKIVEIIGNRGRIIELSELFGQIGSLNASINRLNIFAIEDHIARYSAVCMLLQKHYDL